VAAIIAISGGHDHLQDVQLFGAAEIFEKPFEIASLQAVIVKLLGPPV